MVLESPLMHCNADFMIIALLREFSFLKTINNGVNYYGDKEKTTSI